MITSIPTGGRILGPTVGVEQSETVTLYRYLTLSDAIDVVNFIVPTAPNMLLEGV